MITTDWLAPYACLIVGKILPWKQIADPALPYRHCNGRAGIYCQRDQFLPCRQCKNDFNGQTIWIIRFVIHISPRTVNHLCTLRKCVDQ